ncbi:hypothetical protein DY000_02021796 [Brassica cretica]|uniref:F-box associated domain-containing protein n=1 Tax=Brassica cretica TaxID=69181 RepID=A0ABQ7EE32_BRACR|nr:hypothetical protein DY000_02021796 [Brassica cretica]
MTHYNRPSEVSYNEEITSWRFRVKIHMSYPFYSYGTKMEMTIYGGYEDRFRGLGKQEGKWVEIFRVDVHCAYPDTMAVVFNTKSHFDDPARQNMVFYIRDNIESQIKCVANGDHAYAFRDGLENTRGRGQVIVVLKIYFGPPELWIETVGGLSDFRFNPLLPEVEEFSQSVNKSDPYVRRHGAIGPL